MKLPQIKTCPFKDKLNPYPNSPIMTHAWHSALLFACTEPGIIKKFEEDVQLEFPIAREEDELIVQGDEWALRAFLDWFNKNIWKEDPFDDGTKEV